MDKERGKEILESKGYIEVIHSGRPVWIEYINKDGNAQVKDLQTNEIREVSFADLQETDNPIEL